MCSMFLRILSVILVVCVDCVKRSGRDSLTHTAEFFLRLVESSFDYSATESQEFNEKLLNSPHGLHRYWFEDVLTATDAYAEAP